jgi:serine/threonine protein kinase
MDQDSSTNNRQPTRTNTSGSRAQEEGLPPLSIPDHELLRCIGRGSYGEVWLARNTMGTYRAVKVVYRKSFADQRPFEREVSGIRKFVTPVGTKWTGCGRFKIPHARGE